MAATDDITKLDLFEFLGVDEKATEAEIKKAFRKHALSCHPDKNPDDPNAAQLFQRYSKATEILLDPSARSAYERVLRARKDRAARNRHLDSKRKKLKDDLEARERAAKEEVESEVDAAEKLAREIERLRKEGSKELERQNEELRQQLANELRQSAAGIRQTYPDTANCDLSNVYRLKAKWKKHGGHDENSIRKLLNRYGTILGCAVSRKGTAAIIEFGTRQEALNAMQGVRDADHNLSIELMESAMEENANAKERRVSPPTTQPSRHDHANVNSSNTTPQAVRSLFPTSAAFAGAQPSMRADVDGGDDTEFESNVLLKLKRAQERKRLIESEEAK